MSSAPSIIRSAHTYRTVPLDRTWDRIQPMLETFQITRIADLTGLDEIGLPTHAAYRPAGTTLAVSLGVGTVPLASIISAAMESIEAWHVENTRLRVVATAPTSEIAPPYPIRSMQLAHRSPLTDHTVLDWVIGRGLVTDRQIPVPLDTVVLDFTRRYDWARLLFLPTSNGLAAGNTYAEAVLHGLQELIERECIAEHTTAPPDRWRYVDPTTVTNATTRTIVDALRRPGFWYEVQDITNGLGVPCYRAMIWSEHLPVIFGGFGCHLEPEVAVGRALAEAVLSRMATVSGARDDVHAEVYRDTDPSGTPPPNANRPFEPLRPAPVVPRSITDVIAQYAAAVLRHTGVEPFVVDLTHDDIGIPAVKVFAPGLRMYDEALIQHRVPWDRRKDGSRD